MFYLTEGGHAHANWGFTQPGYYQIAFRYSGILAATGAQIESPAVTYHFGVEAMPAAVPEPATFWLTLAGICLLALFRRRARSLSPFHPNQNEP